MDRTNKTIRIFLLDDHFIVRMGLSSSLNEEDDFEVVGEADSIKEAREVVKACKPDIAIVDMRLPDGMGYEFIEELKSRSPSVRCMILSVNQAENEILQAVKSGARGYITKSSDRDEILDAIRTLARGGSYFPSTIQKLVEKGRARTDLTPREFEVLGLVVEGMLNKEIADRLSLAEITVKQHVSSILKKLHVQDRTQAAIAAVERGLIRLDG